VAGGGRWRRRFSGSVNPSSKSGLGMPSYMSLNTPLGRQQSLMVADPSGPASRHGGAPAGQGVQPGPLLSAVSALAVARAREAADGAAAVPAAPPSGNTLPSPLLGVRGMSTALSKVGTPLSIPI